MHIYLKGSSASSDHPVSIHLQTFTKSRNLKEDREAAWSWPDSCSLILTILCLRRAIVTMNPAPTLCRKICFVTYLDV